MRWTYQNVFIASVCISFAVFLYLKVQFAHFQTAPISENGYVMYKGKQLPNFLDLDISANSDDQSGHPGKNLKPFLDQGKESGVPAALQGKKVKHFLDEKFILDTAHYISRSATATQVKECLPNFDFLQKLRIRKTGRSGNPSTKIITLIAAYEFEDHIVVTLNSEGMNGKQVHCRYLNASLQEVGPPISADILPEWHTYCCRREGTHFMTVTEASSDEITQWVPVQSRIKKEPKYEMSMCLAPIYGRTPSWLLLAETIEHYLLQGVEHFYIYVQDMDGYSKLTLHDYVRSGQAEVIYLDHHEDRPEKEWHIVGVMDCLQRSKHESKWVIMADIDERIMPTTKVNKTLLEYSRGIFDEDKIVAALRFRPRWILRTQAPPEKYNGSKTLDDHLPTLVYHNTSGVPPLSNTPKCIIDPTKVFLMWIHDVEVFMNKDFVVYDVPPEEAIVRHYRDVAISDWGTRWLPVTLRFGAYTNTSYPQALMTNLYKRIQTRLDRIYSGNFTTMQ